MPSSRRHFLLGSLALPVFAVAWLPAVHGFGELASRALSSARPLLVLDDSSVEDYRYRLTTLPA